MISHTFEIASEIHPSIVQCICIKCKYQYNMFAARAKGTHNMGGSTNYIYNKRHGENLYNCEISDEDYKMRELLK